MSKHATWPEAVTANTFSIIPGITYGLVQRRPAEAPAKGGLKTTELLKQSKQPTKTAESLTNMLLGTPEYISYHDPASTEHSINNVRTNNAGTSLF